MEDILSQGGDREPSRWPRRLGVTGAVLLSLALVIVYLTRASHPDSSAATPPTPTSASTAEPTGIAGPTLPWAVSLRLPVAGAQPAWFSPATGASAPIGGLPVDSAGYQFIRAAGGWVVRADSGGELASDDAAAPPLPVWFLGDGARSVTRVGTANQATPAATAGAVWLTSAAPSADPGTAARTAREVSVTGRPLGRAVRLPAGYAIYQATVRGLLLTPASSRSGPLVDKLWNPADRTVSRTFDSVLAASPTEIAWAPACAGICRLQLLNLVNGRSAAVRLPSGTLVQGAAFSPRGDLLALQVMSDQGGGPSSWLEVASAASGRVTALTGTSSGSGVVADFGWPAGGDNLVAEFIFAGRAQLASWHPGARALAVAVVRPGGEQTSLVVG